eukprot:5196902-Amphidinium_carterae.1
MRVQSQLQITCLRCSSWLQNKKKTADEVVEVSALSSSEWQEFLPAVKKEVDSMININKGLRPLFLQKSLDVCHNKPQRIVKSRLLLRWKPVGTETTVIRKPKARWIILGHQDPDALEVGRACRLVVVYLSLKSIPVVSVSKGPASRLPECTAVTTPTVVVDICVLKSVR